MTDTKGKPCVVCGCVDSDGLCAGCGADWEKSPEARRADSSEMGAAICAFDDFVRRRRAERQHGGG